MTFPFNAPLRIRKAPAAQAARALGADDPSPGDDALNRLVKLAPSEIMTVYLAGKAAFAQSLPMLGLVMLIVCFLWRWLTTREEGKPVQWMAILSATISFGLWVYASGGTILTEWKPGEAKMSFIALFWTLLLAPLFNKGD